MHSWVVSCAVESSSERWGAKGQQGLRDLRGLPVRLEKTELPGQLEMLEETVLLA